MAFQIQPGESVAKCVRRLALAQIDNAMIGLTGRSSAGLEEVVHDVRKRFKRVRALIRLAEEGLGRKLAKGEDARFRNAGRPLSEVRDAIVLVETLDRLIERSGDKGRSEAIGPVREVLLRHKQDVFRRVLDEGDTLAHVVRTIKKARRDVSRWEICGGGWNVIERGQRRIFKGGCRTFHKASEAPSDETLHEWRKRVKDLWYVMDILKPVRPEYTESREQHAHKLADLLGNDHDLAVLQQVLLTSEDGSCNSAAEAVLPLIDHRRAELQRDAFALGPALYGERPKVFVARLGAYWRAWRAEVEAAKFASP